MKEIRQIPWVRATDYEPVEGSLLLTINTKAFYALPIMVKDLGDGRFGTALAYDGEKRYSTEDFDYFAIITMPPNTENNMNNIKH